MTIDKKYLLTDAEVAKFIVTGYHMVQLDLPSGINQSIAHQLDALDYNPGDAITDVVPELNLVLDHPVALSGCDVAMRRPETQPRSGPSPERANPNFGARIRSARSIRRWRFPSSGPGSTSRTLR